MRNDILIYVADLAAYNEGIIHGVWIDATQDMVTIETAVDCMLKRSPIKYAEEYAIHDTQGFGQFCVHECQSLETVNQVALFIQEYPTFGAALLNHFGDICEANACAEESYQGCFDNLAAFTQQLTEDISNIPEHLVNYIDYERIARDYEMSGDIFTIETAYNEVHVFWGR